MKTPEERLIELKANLIYLEDTINRLSYTGLGRNQVKSPDREFRACW
jgi:hypothetical protein